jgi:hypothetical protein
MEQLHDMIIHVPCQLPLLVFCISAIIGFLARYFLTKPKTINQPSTGATKMPQPYVIVEPTVLAAKITDIKATYTATLDDGQSIAVTAAEVIGDAALFAPDGVTLIKIDPAADFALRYKLA